VRKLSAPHRHDHRRRGLFLIAVLAAFGAGFSLVALRSQDNPVQPVRILHVPVAVVAAPPVKSPRRIDELIASLPPAAHEVLDFRVQGEGESAAPTRFSLPQYEVQEEMSVPPIHPPALRSPSAGQKLIAIVLDDVGPDYPAAREAIALPSAVTLAFLPYAEQVGPLARSALAGGHEVLVHMPMEPEEMAHNNPGPSPLTTRISAEDVQARVKAALEAVPGEVGLNNHMGSKFTANLPGMQPVLAELARRNLIFLDSRTTAQSAGAMLAKRYGVRFVGRDVFLDNEIYGESILRQLRETERIATRRGQAVAIGHPHDITLDVLREWIPHAKARGFELVPISRLAVKQSSERVAVSE